ncbi:HAD family phosphatase [Patescibacteria group bacterium]|nr:HAD family phosphatase [Patescibacteria group bacterium]MBU2259689.1 HAD family phosphatase [Patescibacteria group bacterium]
MNVKVVIFDVDGVLFDTDEVYFRYLKRALERIGKHLDEKFYTLHGYDDCLYKLDLSEQQIQDVLSELHEKYYSDDIVRGIRLKEDVIPVLQCLAGSLKLATGSGEHKVQIERYLRHFGITEYFSFIGHGDLARGRKSNPKYFHAIAHHFGVQPEECLHIGDSHYDQHGLAAGVNVAIIPTKYSAHITFDTRCHMLGGISEVPKLISNLSAKETG